MTSPGGILTEDSGQPQSSRPLRPWRRIPTIIFILFCLEMGIVLVLFPWSSMWDRNYFFALAPQWATVFSSSYLRGAISGLGVINVWIALSEAWRLRSA
jgi:hypothetical protein